MITIYIVTWNEEFILPLTLAFYKKRFPTAEIIIYDNESTDNTLKIAQDNGCKIITYSTNDKMDEDAFLEIKNNCWKTAKTDWVIVCDCDEWFDIKEADLINRTASIITFTYYTLTSLHSGVKERIVAKYGVFNRTKIKEINYLHGCHSCNPVGEVKYSRRIYRMYHYKNFDINYFLSRYDTYSKRQPIKSIINKWGFQYRWNKSKLKRTFNRCVKKSKLLEVPIF